MNARPTALRERWRALPRTIRWLLAGLLGLYLFYLLAANVFINTGLAPWAINRKPEKFTLEWDGGSSWWPGRVDLHGVRLRGHVMHTRWAVDAERARGRVMLWPLLDKQVRMPDIVADGVSGGVRRDPGPPILPTAPNGRKPWSLRFDRIRTDSVRGGQLGDLQLAATGSAEIGLYKQLRGGVLEMYPSQAHLAGLKLLQQGRELLADARLDAEFRMDPHTRDQAHGIDKLTRLDARVRLGGRTAGLAMERDPQGRPVLRIAQGNGKADIDVHWNRGELAQGSRLLVDSPLLGTRLDGQPLDGRLQARLDVDQDIALHAVVPEQPGSNLKLDADLRLAGRKVPLHDFNTLIGRASGHLVGQWRFPTLAWIPAMFPSTEWLKLQGEGLVDADLQVRDGTMAPGSHLRVPEVQASAEVMGSWFAGQASADLHVEQGEGGANAPVMNLRMQHFAVAAADARATPYIQGNDLRLDLAAGPGERTAAGLRQTTSAHLVFRDAQVPDLRTYNRYLPRSQLRFEGGSGRLSGDLRLLPGGGLGQGEIQLQASAARLHVAGVALRGDVRGDFHLAHANVRERNFSLDHSELELRNVSFSGSNGEQRSGWWARVAVDRGHLDWTAPMAVDADVRVNVRDVGFLMALYAQKRDFPRWIDKVVDAGQTQVVGRVSWHDDQLALDNLRAQNNRFTVLARLRMADAHRSGSLYADWGVLSAALETRDGDRDWHLIRARQWYDGQPSVLAADRR